MVSIEQSVIVLFTVNYCWPYLMLSCNENNTFTIAVIQ